MSKDDTTSLLYSIVNMNNFFGKNVGLFRVDQYGRKLKGDQYIDTEVEPFITQHMKAAYLLKLENKARENARLMGFGLWNKQAKLAIKNSNGQTATHIAATTTAILSTIYMLVR